MTIERVRGEGSWEETIGSARAVAAGDRVFVAGTMPFAEGAVEGEGDPYTQARAAFGHALAELARFGLGAESVVRTRMYLAHARDVEAVGRAHAELFGAVRPAATLVVVSGFADSRVLVEVEVEAFREAHENRRPQATQHTREARETRVPGERQ
ncbi:RidA family protein [Streptomyces sp. JJ66]|uniref:Rid family hydrolase n=1 Tax=Streptomyces sp. JJ66 TaxID=2803843 RepID=UPI001C5A2703|nr:Rid family hydrolase [Streptomyces sp. JJ66]MBW1604040.1 RidA family protein [Streptomyces sp. JJ66]